MCTQFFKKSQNHIISIHSSMDPSGGIQMKLTHFINLGNKKLLVILTVKLF
jgi:hypothetical protein